MLKNSTRRHDSVTTRKAFWTFCLLLAVFFLPFVIRGHPPLSRAFFTDAVVQFYPWLKLAEAQLWRGEPPLWNPFNFCGSPLLANGQAAVFYPLNFLLYLLPDTPALILIAAAKLFIGGTFMWAFLRRQKLPPNASFLGAIVFVFSGYMLGWLRFPITNVYSLLPAAMFFTHKLVFENSAGAWAGLSLTVGSMILGGQPQALVAAALLTLPYGFLFWVRSPEKISGVKLLGAYAAGLSIGAVQLLPFLEYLDWSAASKVRSLFNFFWYPAIPEYCLGLSSTPANHDRLSSH